MKKIIEVLTVFLIITIFSSIGISKLEINQVRAACPTGYTCAGGCTRDGQCINNKTCVAKCVKYEVLRYENGQPILGKCLEGQIVITNRSCGSAIIGKVEPPKGVSDYNLAVVDSKGSNIGILIFASKLFKLVNIAAGLLFFANFTMAGYAYITSAGNTNIMTEIKDKLTFSIIGIIIIVAAYTGAALFGYIFFGDPGIVLNPDLTKYGALAPPTP